MPERTSEVEESSQRSMASTSSGWASATARLSACRAALVSCPLNGPYTSSASDSSSPAGTFSRAATFSHSTPGLAHVSPGASTLTSPAALRIYALKDVTNSSKS